MNKRKWTARYRDHLIVYVRLTGHSGVVTIYEPGDRVIHEEVAHVGEIHDGDRERNLNAMMLRLHRIIDRRHDGVEERDQEIKWYH
jgi:hypothetical protein